MEQQRFILFDNNKTKECVYATANTYGNQIRKKIHVNSMLLPFMKYHIGCFK